MTDCFVELRAKGRTATSLLPYDTMNVNGWLRRARVVYAAPSDVIASYIPLASTTFANLYGGGDVLEKAPGTITIIGDVGLGLALDDNLALVVSVEGIALHQLVQTEGTPHATPGWLTRLESTWTSNQCLFMHQSTTGWRGIFAEHRLWSSILLSKNESIKTPHSKPTVRGWVPQPIIEDLKTCVGEATVLEVTEAIKELGFDGAPDLVCWRQDHLWCVEVKSATDALRTSQVEMLTRLARIEKVKCSICCPDAARKRLAATMEAFAESDSE